MRSARLQRRRDHEGTTIRQAWGALLAHGVALITVIACGLFAYSSSQPALEAPRPPQWHADALIFLDQPAVPARLDVRVTEPSVDSVEYGYKITVEGAFAGDDIGFFLLLSGRARFDTTFPDGSPVPAPGGCAQFGVSAPLTTITCHTGVLPPDGPSLSLGALDSEPVQVIQGRIQRSDSDAHWTLITTYSSGALSTSAGARTYFSLPNFGTQYVPEGYEAEIQFQLTPDAEPAWVPVDLETYVEYREVVVNERVDNVSPDLVDPGHLIWGESAASSIRPFGSLVDTTAEAEGQTDLFLAGAALGVLGGFVPPLIGGIGRWVVRLRNVRGDSGRSRISPTGWPGRDDRAGP